MRDAQKFTSHIVKEQHFIPKSKEITLSVFTSHIVKEQQEIRAINQSLMRGFTSHIVKEQPNNHFVLRYMCRNLVLEYKWYKLDMEIP